MSFQFATSDRNAALSALIAAIGANPIIRIRTGLVPANAAAADAGTVVATLNLPTTWMNAPSGGQATMTGTWSDSSADATGVAGHFRLYDSGGSTCRIQGIASGTWQASKAYALNDHAMNGGNLYRCTTAGTSASSGGPTGTGTGISDGTAVWSYVQPGNDMVIDNPSLAATQAFSITSFTLTAGGA